MSEHRSFPKPTPRLQDRVAKRRDAMRAWLACCAAVDQRDRFVCRYCGRKTRKTLTVCPERLEHHHLVGRNVAPELVTATRNVICVCLECHGKLTRHEVEPIGYLDANGPLHFTQAEPAAG